MFSPDHSTPVPGRVVAVGGLIQRKGLDVLIKAIAVAVRKTPTLHVVVAGDGPASHQLIDLASRLGVASRVHFLGKVRREDLPDLYRSATAACHPSRLDNFPAAPLEAMATGVPVLVSDRGALPEMVGEAGIVHPAEDSNTLADQLITLMADPKKRALLAGAARERALSCYSWDVICERYLELYSRLKGSQATDYGIQTR
jgi:glycosyltransferase involved in cell wall biosynthesis